MNLLRIYCKLFQLCFTACQYSKSIIDEPPLGEKEKRRFNKGFIPFAHAAASAIVPKPRVKCRIFFLYIVLVTKPNALLSRSRVPFSCIALSVSTSDVDLLYRASLHACSAFSWELKDKTEQHQSKREVEVPLSPVAWK